MYGMMRVADALAERGCRGETLGFTNGKAIVLGPTPPPLVADKPRYVWHVQRTVTIYFQAEKDEIVMSSYFENRHITDPSTALQHYTQCYTKCYTNYM